MTNFNMFVDLISKKSPLQKKKIGQMLANSEQTYFHDAEIFSSRYLEYLNNQAISLDFAVDAYVKMCNDMMKCQISFMKTGKYPAANVDTYNEVYNDMATMKSYMVGLAISQVLWPTHYAIFKSFEKIIMESREDIGAYLEIGPGHGLFMDKALEHLQDTAEITAVEISATSLDITKSIITFFHPQDAGRIKYHNMDMLDLDLNNKYDFIMMGEVLEHVTSPDRLLKKLKELLSERGKAFISTCIDCPAIDHVYHFRCIRDIHDMFDGAGLKVVNEQLLPVENLPLEEIRNKQITINYCAVVKGEWQ